MTWTERIPRYHAIGRTMQVTPSAISTADNWRVEVNPKAVPQPDCRPRTIKCTSARMAPYKQSDTEKFTIWVSVSAGAPVRVAAKMLENIPPTRSMNSKAITTRKSTSFQGFSDSMTSNYTPAFKVTMEKVRHPIAPRVVSRRSGTVSPLFLARSPPAFIVMRVAQMEDRLGHCHRRWRRDGGLPEATRQIK